MEPTIQSSPGVDAMAPAPMPEQQTSNKWKTLGAGALVIIAVAAGLLWWSKYRYMSNTTHAEAELEQMLASSNPREAVEYVMQNPSAVNPFDYMYVFNYLWNKGDREQSAFWFYLWQSRTGAWVKLDPQEDRSAALKSAVNSSAGATVNAWAFSDIDALSALVERVISYEKTFSFYAGKPDPSISDADWDKALLDARAEFENGFKEIIGPYLTPEGKQKVYDQRKSGGLYVGPWQDPGASLPDNWR